MNWNEGIIARTIAQQTLVRKCVLLLHDWSGYIHVSCERRATQNRDAYFCGVCWGKIREAESGAC